MHPNEVSRSLSKGDFIAGMQPLCLLRVEEVGDINPGDNALIKIHCWSPTLDEESQYIGPLSPSNFRDLWSSQNINFAWFTFHDQSRRSFDPQVGDVWIAIVSHEVIVPQLFFIGPDTDKERVHILADWIVPSVMHSIQLYQPGPGRRKPKTLSMYERLRDPQVGP